MWKQSVASNNKLHVYSKIKLTFQSEKYLSVVRNTFDRIAVTKLRISNHILPIETGRYKNIERKQRLCTLCSSSIGDEFHCALLCKNEKLRR